MHRVPPPISDTQYRNSCGIAIPNDNNYQKIIKFRVNCNEPHPILDAAHLRSSYA